jgi:hypothetical protein
MPGLDASVLHEALTNNEYLTDGDGHFSFSCDTNALLSIYFGNLSINLGPEAYVRGQLSTFPNGTDATNWCVSVIQGVDNISPPWVFGTPFLVNVDVHLRY